MDARAWYDIKPLEGKTKDRTQAISYDTMYWATCRAFNAVGLASKARTHAARGSGCQMTELAGAEETQIRRLGRWNMPSMEDCYQTALPRKAKRALTGFPADHQTEPPVELQHMVFGFIDPIWEKYMSQESQNIATGGFLTLLKHLWVVFLHDSAALLPRCADHPIWKHPLFATDAYKAYVCHARDEANNLVPPAQVTCGKSCQN
ncbi:TPA: hypothetical protein N0F65_004963 [Lagenidium giganteum]|uniref:Ndc10 domain-containing protein n=1 Tax=Lagenidium giganteum TaxID=4803 RepID=A0AAV2YL64_9STRA|nr:TPA: hypothetical protein N0F65_004963 [Lagenidium giganteum]